MHAQGCSEPALQRTGVNGYCLFAMKDWVDLARSDCYLNSKRKVSERKREWWKSQWLVRSQSILEDRSMSFY